MITLTHTFTGTFRLGKKLSRWVIKVNGVRALETGCSVIVLEWLRGRNMDIPPIMASPTCFDTEYEVTWEQAR